MCLHDFHYVCLSAMGMFMLPAEVNKVWDSSLLLFFSTAMCVSEFHPTLVFKG